MSDVRGPIAGALAALALLLVLVNIVLELANGGTQAEVNQRQAYINQNAAVMNVDNALIRALANAAVSHKDAQIEDALKRASVTYTLAAPPPLPRRAGEALAMPEPASRLILDAALRWPLVLLAAAFLIATGFRTERLIQQRIDLGAIRVAQEQAVQNGRKLRSQLDQLADATARLAVAGDANAKTIVEEMGRQGVTLRPKS
jgi:hypothetical protein